MKYSFNFIQVTNWLMICRENIKKIRDKVLNEEISKEKAIELLQTEKNKVTKLKDILHRKIRLHGIQHDFLKNLKEIKKEYGIDD